MNARMIDNDHDEMIAQKINQVAEQTNANSQFAAELEERLRNAHGSKISWFTSAFQQVSPVLRWVALMILLGLVLSLSIKTLIPAPQPAANDTPSVPNETPTLEDTNTTPVPQGKTFNYGDAQLIMSIPFPDSPAQTNVYHAFRSEPATAEYVRALAKQFGIEGELYTNTTMGESPDGAPFVVTDGKQELLVHSQNNYEYTSDKVKNFRNFASAHHDNAEAIIREYMQTHGFDFDFRVEAEEGSFGGYVLQQLSPDGLPIVSETQANTRVTLDEEGNILSVNMSVTGYEPAPLGSFGILTAEDALKQMASETLLGGSMESSGSGPDPNLAPPRYWYHDYPDNQTVTVYGNVTVYPAVDPNTPAMIFLENVPVTGNTSGMETLGNYRYIQVTGQFAIENGVRKLHVETWNEDVQMICASGGAQREGEQIMIITDEAGSVSEYTLVDPPADLPLDTKSTLPDSQLINCGVAVDGQFYWSSIQFYTDSSQMGGGGGGGGFFFQLNLSGTPVPFPTSTPTNTILPPFDYTVVAGDTCASIGMAFGVSVQSIATLNNLSTNCIISVGQGLKIPYPTPTSGQSSAYSSAELSAFPRYIVQANDTLEAIAQSYNVSAEEIRQANDMPDNNTVVAGSVIIIPTTRLEGERGIVTVQIYGKPDGRQRASYTFVTEGSESYFELKGDNLETLQKVANRPINIWGDISANETGMTFLTLEKFELIYPDLQFQILTGTQELKEIGGEEVNLFTTGGTTYVQLSPSGNYPDFSSSPNGGEVILQVLQIPDETYAGYPALRVFVVAPAINPTTGKPMELPRSADTIEVMPDPLGNADSYTPPDITIEKVELIYYASDPSFYDDTVEATQVYLQPVWYFQGHNTNGDEVNIYIQALRQEYLIPQTEP